ncbi:hypothetical protein J6590_064107 [Homalodisca vitripennis]|nr:hypothetical protein J6590_064107 [Homalodisca vitripennis]
MGEITRHIRFAFFIEREPSMSQLLWSSRSPRVPEYISSERSAPSRTEHLPSNNVPMDNPTMTSKWSLIRRQLRTLVAYSFANSCS